MEPLELTEDDAQRLAHGAHHLTHEAELARDWLRLKAEVDRLERALNASRAREQAAKAEAPDPRMRWSRYQ